MRRCALSRGLFSLLAVPAILASGLLSPDPCRAQANQSDKSATQSQPSATDKPGQKDDQTSDSTTVRLRIRVTNSEDKPVGNASVYVRFNQPGGFLHKDKLAELSFKTNEDGSVKVPGVPQGKILIQVIAKGLHTFGKWFDIEKDQDTIEIKLDPAPRWY
jgi:Carboxypeptidase regulatory-like domain